MDQERLSKVIEHLVGNPFEPRDFSMIQSLVEEGMLPASEYEDRIESWIECFNRWKKSGGEQNVEYCEWALVAGMTQHMASEDSKEAFGLTRGKIRACAERLDELWDTAWRNRLLTNELRDRLAGYSDKMEEVRQKTWTAAFGENLLASRELAGLIQSTPVLIRGETGTGKEIVARALRYCAPGSWNAEKKKWTAPPYEAAHLASLPTTTVNDELFGHAKGAFTGAERAKQGLFERCAGGVVFLDEIAELPKGMQVALLRVLQEKTVRRLGDSNDIPCAMRVISATNRDLDLLARKGKFRPDLNHRLKSIVISLPPLSEHKEDIPIIVENDLGHFTHNLAMKDTVSTFLDDNASYDWPGNVRELQAAVRALALGLEPQLESGGETREPGTGVPRDIERGEKSLAYVKKWYVAHVRSMAGNDVEAAARLGVHRDTVARHTRRSRT